jgi:hypothetical protein
MTSFFGQLLDHLIRHPRVVCALHAQIVATLELVELPFRGAISLAFRGTAAIDQPPAGDHGDEGDLGGAGRIVAIRVAP